MVKSKAVLIHGLFWISYIAIAVIVYGYKKNAWPEYIFETTISHAISAGIFYITALYVFPKYDDRKRLPTIFLLLILVLISSIGIRFFTAFIVSPYILNKNLSVSKTEIDTLVLKFFFQWLTFSLYAFFYWQALLKIKLQKELSDQQAQRAEKEKLELEITALRAQINPHFIFNSLQHFRSQTMDSDPEVSHGIGCFMQILRAGIITPGLDGKVPLKIESGAIEGTIYIFEQRFPDIEIDYAIEIKDEDSIRIYPHILLPFVENAFKHGAFKESDYAIKIRLFADEQVIKLSVFNKKGDWIKDSSTGIGLRYVKRHLESGYRNKHNLIINDAAETYSVDLTVHLN
ncbi:MAG: histidine kinase [Sphingobacterium sp.]|jgi:sensor histidine kinase YesM|nr:histidine kinase [Sphingobacterium sp.]